MSERVKMMGRRVELRREVKGLEAELEALRGQLRDALDPVEDVAVLRGDAIATTAVIFGEKQLVLKELLRKLEIVDRELG